MRFLLIFQGKTNYRCGDSVRSISLKPDNLTCSCISNQTTYCGNTEIYCQRQSQKCLQRGPIVYKFVNSVKTKTHKNAFYMFFKFAIAKILKL